MREKVRVRVCLRVCVCERENASEQGFFSSPCFGVGWIRVVIRVIRVIRLVHNSGIGTHHKALFIRLREPCRVQISRLASFSGLNQNQMSCCNVIGSIEVSKGVL